MSEVLLAFLSGCEACEGKEIKCSIRKVCSMEKVNFYIPQTVSFVFVIIRHKFFYHVLHL